MLIMTIDFDYSDSLIFYQIFERNKNKIKI